MTDDLREWQDKLTKVVGRVGKDLVVNDASEVSEIVRRRLFEECGPGKYAAGGFPAVRRLGFPSP
jgi:hypothetical protein